LHHIKISAGRENSIEKIVKDKNIQPQLKKPKTCTEYYSICTSINIQRVGVGPGGHCDMGPALPDCRIYAHAIQHLY